MRVCRQRTWERKWDSSIYLLTYIDKSNNSLRTHSATTTTSFSYVQPLINYTYIGIFNFISGRNIKILRITGKQSKSFTHLYLVSRAKDVNNEMNGYKLRDSNDYWLSINKMDGLESSVFYRCNWFGLPCRVCIFKYRVFFVITLNTAAGLVKSGLM